MIICNDVEKSFYSKENSKSFTLAIRELTIGQSETIAILGPNGSGKTTLIKSILNLVLIEEGQISIFGDENSNSDVRKLISYLPERFECDMNMTVDMFYNIYLRIKDLNNYEIDTLKKKIYNYFEINYYQKKLSELSKGMMQRVLIGYALSLPDIKCYILDEPYTALDYNQRVILNNKIKELKKDATFIISSHDINDLSDVIDSVCLIKEGIIVEKKSFDKIINEYSSIGNYYLKVLK